MARIKGSSNKPTPPGRPRSWALPEAVWFALGLGGVVTAIAAPAEAPWLVQPAAVVVSGLGFYGLGRAHGQAQPDPAARSRVTQLERALLTLTWLGGDGPPRDADRPTARAAGQKPRADASIGGEERGGGPGGAADADLSAPLPGEA